jgi:hypothetical protein
MKKTSLLHAFPIFLLLTGFLAGCASGPQERVWLRAPGWSRGVAIGGTELAGPPPIALGPDQELITLLFPSAGGPSLVRVETDTGSVTQPRPIQGLEGNRLTQPSIQFAGNQLWLLWIEGDSLRRAVVDLESVAVEQQDVVSGDLPVADYSAAVSPANELVVWFSGGVDNPGVYQVSGRATGPVAIAPAGVRPSIVFDEAGNLHATWIDVPESQGLAPIHYASYSGGDLGGGQTRVVAEPSLSPSDGLQGPLLGLTQERAMVFYVITVRTGLEAGKIKPYYFSFPLDDLSVATVPTTLQVPGSADLSYTVDPTGGLQAGPRASLDSPGPPGEHVSQLAIPNQPVPEMAAALRARTEFRMNQEQTQIGLLYLNGAKPTAYQQLTFTMAGSSQPSLVADPADHLDLGWLEPAEGEGYTVFLASTRPSLVDAFRGVTGRDVRQMASESVFGMLSGIVLVPLALVWMIAPLLVVVISSIWRSGDDRLSRPSTWIPLLLAIAAYWVAKRAFLPEVFSYVPFSAWVPIIGPTVGTILRLGLPILGSALGFWVAYAYTYGRDRTSPTFFVLIFSAVDAVVSMALYGGLFLGF